MKLKESIITALPVPQRGNKIFYDDVITGFGLRVTSTGVRSFVFNYRAKLERRERRITIGRWPIWTVEDARAQAASLRRVVDRGGDPFAYRLDDPELAEIVAAKIMQASGTGNWISMAIAAIQTIERLMRHGKA